MKYCYACLFEKENIENIYSLADDCDYTDEEWGEVFDRFND